MIREGCGALYVCGHWALERPLLIGRSSQLATQDCRDVEEQVQKAFEGEEAPSASIIYVGQKPE